MLPLKEKWLLRLYVAGPGRQAAKTRANLERLCQQHIQGRYRIDVTGADPQDGRRPLRSGTRASLLQLA